VLHRSFLILNAKIHVTKGPYIPLGESERHRTSKQSMAVTTRGQKKKAVGADNTPQQQQKGSKSPPRAQTGKVTKSTKGNNARAHAPRAQAATGTKSKAQVKREKIENLKKGREIKARNAIETKTAPKEQIDDQQGATERAPEANSGVPGKQNDDGQRDSNSSDHVCAVECNCSC